MYARIHHFKRFCLKIVILNTVNNVFFSATIMTMFWNYWLTIPYYKVCKLECVEIAIWPLLYLKEEWCESNVKGHVSIFTYIF